MKKRLEELLEFVESTDLQEVIWEKKGSHISFRRSGHMEKSGSALANSAPASAESMPSAEPSRPASPLTIRSGMVGTFFRSDSPDRPPMVVEGTIVTSGQPVGAIEAMKIMKDVLSPGPCKIIKALVANGHAVEYGQPLFEIEPQPEEAAHV